jgi:hypothetical protein
MSAEVAIDADESPTEVMVVPVEAIVGSPSLRETSHCFVVGTDGQPLRRDLALGMSNAQLVEVKSGLKVGDRVVLNPASVAVEHGEAARDGARPLQAENVEGSSTTRSAQAR